LTSSTLRDASKRNSTLFSRQRIRKRNNAAIRMKGPSGPHEARRKTIVSTEARGARSPDQSRQNAESISHSLDRLSSRLNIKRPRLPFKILEVGVSSQHQQQ